MTIAHLVAHTHGQWGHDKPLIAFMGRLVERRPASALLITFLVSSSVFLNLRRELGLMPGDMLNRVNLIDVGPVGGGLRIPGFTPYFEDLWAMKTVVCKTTKREYSLPRPTFTIIDIFRPHDMPTVKRVSGGACPVLAWVPFPMTSFLRFAGPTELGGLADLTSRAEAAAAETGETVDEAAERLYREVNGRVVKTPSLPDVYDYEFFPQESVFHEGSIIRWAPASVKSSDGVINVTSSTIEEEAIEAVRAWLKRTGKDLWIVGPLEDTPPEEVKPASDPDEDKRILKFCDDMQTKYGENSITVISFGTIFYPKDMEKLRALFDELLASETPFLWAHASKIMPVPLDLAAMIDACEFATHASWIPQRAVLRHAAAGWFISHGGWNSVQEALAFRVPLIMWPFSADQPANTELLRGTHDAAFDLVSVRAGSRGAQQPLRLKGQPPVDFSIEGVRREVRDLLQKTKGPEGERVRANALRLSNELARSWREGGEASKEVERLLHQFVPVHGFEPRAIQGDSVAGSASWSRALLVVAVVTIVWLAYHHLC